MEFRFVYEKDRRKAIELFRNIAKVNKRPTKNLREIEILIYEENHKSFSVLDLIRYKSLRKQTYACAIVYVCIVFNYYGISFSMSTVGINIYLNILIVGTAEMFAYIFSNKMISVLKR